MLLLPIIQDPGELANNVRVINGKIPSSDTPIPATAKPRSLLVQYPIPAHLA